MIERTQSSTTRNGVWVKDVWRGRFISRCQPRERGRGQTRGSAAFCERVPRHIGTFTKRELVRFNFGFPLIRQSAVYPSLPCAGRRKSLAKMPPIENDAGKNELKTRIQQLIDTNKVMVFSKTYCPYCVKVSCSFCRRDGGSLLNFHLPPAECSGLGLITGVCPRCVNADTG